MSDYKDLLATARRRLPHREINDHVLDTTEDLDVKLSGVSRRDFLRVSSTFGLSSALIAASSMTGIFSADALAAAANSVYDKRFSKPVKHNLRMGTAFSNQQTLISRVGTLTFAQDIEERTDGEIRIEILDAGTVCNEPTCIQQSMQGVLDIGLSSTQNASSVAPWLNALDFPFMFQSNGQIYHFMFNPKSEELFRKVYRERHNMEFLFTHAEMRKLFLGAKWADKDPVTSVTQLEGTKNRVTNTQLGRIAMQLMKLNPVPVAWAETLDAMKSGLIDGMETWVTACTAFNMTPVVSKYVGLNFIPGTSHTAISSASFGKLESNLQDAMMESAYLAQIDVMKSNEAALISISGEVPNPGKSTILGQHGVEMNFLTPEALKEAEDMASPTRPEYDVWHERLNQMAGFNVYETLLPVAREYDASSRAIDVEPRRWWKSA